MATPILGTNVASAIVPFTDADQFATHRAKYGHGGWRSVDTISERNGLPEDRKEVGMVVFVIETQEGYMWNGSTWDFFVKGGDQTPKRQSVSHLLGNLAPGQKFSFILPLAKTSVILRLSVTRPVKITAWSTAARDEPNPYIFLATAGHLTDDGATLLSDGTILRSRQYSIFANLEDPPSSNIYFDIESVDLASGSVSLDIIYLPIEKDVGS